MFQYCWWVDVLLVEEVYQIIRRLTNTHVQQKLDEIHKKSETL